MAVVIFAQSYSITDIINQIQDPATTTGPTYKIAEEHSRKIKYKISNDIRSLNGGYR